MRFYQRIIGVPGLSNLGVVRDGAIYRSAQPEDYSQLAICLGIKRVMTLREKAESFADFRLRLNVLSDVSIEDFDLIVQTLSNPENQPILVHCQSGADRTGVACAAYRITVDGWSLAEAWEELECYGGGIHNILNLKLKYHLELYAEAKGLNNG